mmetsp:Transcript_12441/g.39840  ORF Transcript_12441/g.39840 Transcript_12441/m.39840 type:complete len:213 (+) Transcript_12441:76-714(+)
MPEVSRPCLRPSATREASGLRPPSRPRSSRRTSPAARGRSPRGFRSRPWRPWSRPSRRSPLATRRPTARRRTGQQSPQVRCCSGSLTVESFAKAEVFWQARKPSAEFVSCRSCRCPRIRSCCGGPLASSLWRRSSLPRQHARSRPAPVAWCRSPQGLSGRPPPGGHARPSPLHARCRGRLPQSSSSYRPIPSSASRGIQEPAWSQGPTLRGS